MACIVQVILPHCSDTDHAPLNVLHHSSSDWAYVHTCLSDMSVLGCECIVLVCVTVVCILHLMLPVVQTRCRLL